MKVGRGVIWMKAILVAISFYAISKNVDAQSSTQDSLPFHGLPIGVVLFEGDSIPVFMLDEVTVVEKFKFKSEKQQNRYTKLVRDVKKTLPYARLCRAEIDEIERTLNSLESKAEKEKYVKAAEKELFDKFEKPLKNLTFSQGRILIKLIDRETGNTSYNLIKDLKGGFSAFVWQSVARMFGSNLKSEYDSIGEDAQIESIIYLIDRGAY